MSQKPKLLYFTYHCPYGKSYGARLRSRHLAEQLSKVVDVHLVVIPLETLTEEQIEETNSFFPGTKYFKFEKRSKSLADRCRNEFDPYFTNTHGARVETAAQEMLNDAVIEGYMLWFFGLRIANAFEIPNSANSILDIDDIQSQFWRSRYQQANDLKEKVKCYRKVLQWKRREQVLLKRFKSVSVCSKIDQSYLMANGLDADNIAVLPNGFSLNKEEQILPKPDKNEILIGFIGTLEYQPNVDGVDWFIKNVWDTILDGIPNAKLRLVGANTDKVRGEAMDGLGFVDDVAEEISQWTLTIVPILVGGGTRIKIAEAFCRECPVVSTRLGAFGYEVTDGEELLLADGERDFADACIRLMRNPELAAGISKKAKKFYERGLSWDALEPRLRKLIEEVK